MPKYYDAQITYDAPFLSPKEIEMREFLIKLVMLHLDYDEEKHEEQEEKLVFAVRDYLRDKHLWEAL